MVLRLSSLNTQYSISSYILQEVKVSLLRLHSYIKLSEYYNHGTFVLLDNVFSVSFIRHFVTLYT